MIIPEKYRVNPPSGMYRSRPGDQFGMFVIPDRCDRILCIVSDGQEAPSIGLERWEHVSVSVRNRKMDVVRRCPTWEQMCLVKSIFWEDEQPVMQLHPRASEYVNSHAFCLHLWRPVDREIPTPPSIFVGDKNIQVVR